VLKGRKSVFHGQVTKANVKCSVCKKTYQVAVNRSRTPNLSKINEFFVAETVLNICKKCKKAR